MDKGRAALLVATLLVSGCSGDSTSWMPWSTTPAETKRAYTPPGATAYTCEGGKRLLVRYEGGGKTAWVIYPDRQFRLDRAVSASGERYSNGATVLATKEGEALLEESGKVEFANCKLEKAK